MSVEFCGESNITMVVPQDEKAASCKKFAEFIVYLHALAVDPYNQQHARVARVVK